MYQIEGEAGIPQPDQKRGDFPHAQAKQKAAHHNEEGRKPPYKNAAKAQDIDCGLCGDETGKTQQKRCEAEKESHVRKSLSGNMLPESGEPVLEVQRIEPTGPVIGHHAIEKFQHHRISVKCQKGRRGRQQPGCGCKGKEKDGADQSPEPVAQAQSDKKQKIKENLTVYRPTYAHQGLERAASDVKGEEQKTFDQKDGIRLGLFKHAGKQ